VLDRASTFSNPEVVELLQTKFIPVAIDQAYQRRQKDAEGRFYQKIANQGPRKVGDGGPTTQGRYLATADGQFLGFNNNRDTERLLKLMRQALDEYQPKSVAAIEAGKPDRRWNYQPPQGGLVARVNTKILGGYEQTDDEWRQLFQQGIGRDNLWIRKDEHHALVKGEVLPSLAIRLARFHLVDNTRGEPPMWKPEEIVKWQFELSEDGKLVGFVHLRTASGDREFKADLLGVVESKNGEVTRFDLVAKGMFRGEGRYTRNAPKGEFPLGVAFRLADGFDIADSVPPQGSRGWLDGYIR
jgi:hypothetical protein